MIISDAQLFKTNEYGRQAASVQCLHDCLTQFMQVHARDSNKEVLDSLYSVTIGELLAFAYVNLQIIYHLFEKIENKVQSAR